MKILFVEDDKVIASGLCYSLTQEGYSVTHCLNVESAKAQIEENNFDLAILDLALPDGSGYDICKMMKSKKDIPVIFLTAIDDEVNVVMGLDMGADDYITEPFRIRELLSRIKSVLRRYGKTESQNALIEFSDIKIDTAQAKVYKGEQEIMLTSLEYRLLLIFANNEGQVLSRGQLLESLWDFAGDFVNDNTLTVYIKRLREKIEDDSQNPTIIKTVRGIGYKGAVNVLRNKEIKIYILISILVMAIGTIACFFIDIIAGFITFSTLILMFIAFLLLTKWRYNQIEELSRYLKRIANGEYFLDIRDNNEGELSILKSEIYKVTVTLREQAELLKKDKIFLADSISDISHQLKTPITSMFVMADLLYDENLPQDKRLEFTENIRSQLERLQWLVSSLLKLSKIDVGTIEFEKENVNVKELISKAVEHLLIPMEIKEQTLEINGDENTQFIGDFNWSSEAVTNIIKNCIEHTPCGGKISINFSETPIYTMIKIFDNGVGIHKDDLPYIFNRFYKGKNSDKDSIGIGLAMSKSILQKQGGIIEVTSEKDKGTQFTIKIYKNIV